MKNLSHSSRHCERSAAILCRIIWTYLKQVPVIRLDPDQDLPIESYDEHFPYLERITSKVLYYRYGQNSTV